MIVELRHLQPFDYAIKRDNKEGAILYLSSLPNRHWKDHFKNDLRSDQDHHIKIDLRSDQDHVNFFLS
jgi:hypothetical protein